jgi:hypothetical protein
MNRILKHTILPFLVVAICYSQIGVLLYEVYCNCKKETSVHLHYSLSECANNNSTQLQQTCCSASKKCCLSTSDSKPCTEKDVKLLKLESAKTIVENKFDSQIEINTLTDFTFEISSYNFYDFLRLVESKTPPDTEIRHSVFYTRTISFTQSYLC